MKLINSIIYGEGTLCKIATENYQYLDKDWTTKLVTMLHPDEE